MSNCSKHKKEVAGITDMKQIADMVGDLHYEALALFFTELQRKLYQDALKDKLNGRKRLADALLKVSNDINDAAYHAYDAWNISKPFMKNNEQ